MPKKIVLAYSGGLDTSAIIPWLLEHQPGCEVIAVVGDVGQGAGELAGVEDKALASGASSCIVRDLREEFLTQYVFPTLAAGAVYEGRYLLGTSMARPILAKAQAEVAIEVGADAVAHGCTGKGNDQVRFESVYATMIPHIEVIAPWRIWNLRSREDLLDYLALKGVPTTASREKIYSRDRNIWHISHEGGALESPWNPAPDDIWTWTTDPAEAPDAPGEVTISFRSAVPVALDGERLGPVALLEKLNELGAVHGVGRIDIIENRLVGMKSRGCYETPGGTILLTALQALEELILDRSTRRLKAELALDFAQLVYDGQWFTPARSAVSAAVESIARPLTGDVVVRLYKGTATAIRRRSPNALYSEEFATFGADTVYDHAHSEGFVRLFSLPSRIRAMSASRQVAARAPQPRAASMTQEAAT